MRKLLLVAFYAMIFFSLNAKVASADDSSVKAALKDDDKGAVDSDEDKDEADTKFNFDAATLEGKIKAPPGMTLKGRVEQNKNQMVRLRENFRAELKKSSSAVRAIKARE